jgi:hypothetical protein
MSVSISTVSLESCFSLAGRVIEERRRWLLPHMVEMLICVKDWELGDARAQHQVEKEMQELEALLGSKQHVEGQASGKE